MKFNLPISKKIIPAAFIATLFFVVGFALTGSTVHAQEEDTSGAPDISKAEALQKLQAVYDGEVHNNYVKAEQVKLDTAAAAIACGKSLTGALGVNCATEDAAAATAQANFDQVYKVSETLKANIYAIRKFTEPLTEANKIYIDGVLNGTAYCDVITADGQLIVNGRKCTGASTIDKATSVSEAAAAQKYNQNVGKFSGETCGNPVASTFTVGACVRYVVASVLYIIVTVLSLLLWVGGVALDTVVNLTVLNIKTNLDSIQSIGVIWTTFRDLANLAFIFILLYVSIITILNVKQADARRTIAMIVLAAILINFSLFITKFVIDVSNIFTLAFYNKLVPNGSLLSSTIMQSLGITKMISGEANNTIQQWSDSWSTLLATAIGMIAVLVTAAFSMLTIAWMFIIRFVVIIFILILSPLAFAAIVLPRTQDYTKKWWNALVGQSLFPPIYMLLTWVAVTVASSTSSAGSFMSFGGDPKEAFNSSAATGSLGDAAQSTVANFIGSPAFHTMSVLLRYVVLIAFLNIALYLAKSQAKKAGSYATSAFEFGTKRIDIARKGTYGYLGRGTVRATGLRRIDERFKKSAFGNTRLGQSIRKSTTGLVTDSKFGSKYSVEGVDKENKKLRESFAKEQVKDVEKKFDKDLPKLRDQKIGEYNNNIQNYDAQIAEMNSPAGVARHAQETAAKVSDLERQIREKQEAIARQKRIAGHASYNPQMRERARLLAEKNEKEVRDLEQKRKVEITNVDENRARKIEDLKDKRQKIVDEKLKVEKRKAEKTTATQQEKDEFLRPRQEAHADTLGPEEKSRTHKVWAFLSQSVKAKDEAAQELRNKARGKKGKRDELLKELQDELASEGGGGGEGGAPAPTPAPSPAPTP